MMDFEKKERIKESGYVENKTQINLKALWIATEDGANGKVFK